MLRNFILNRWHGLRRNRSVIRQTCLFVTVLTLLICTLVTRPLYSEPVQTDSVQDIVHTSTFTRIQKPLIVRSDRKTLEYFINHVEELTKHGKDFSKKKLILDVIGDGRYGIQMPSKNITGEFQLVEQTSDKATYRGHGNALSFFSFSGTIVLQVNYTTQHDEKGDYEDVRTAVYLKFDNGFLAILTKAVSPILIPKLDRLIAQFSSKTKHVIESAYANKECP